MEETGHEEEGAEDEEPGSTVEEGEEAAVALGALSADSRFPWLPVNHDGPGQGGDATMSTEGTRTREVDVLCR